MVKYCGIRRGNGLFGINLNQLMIFHGEQHCYGVGGINAPFTPSPLQIKLWRVCKISRIIITMLQRSITSYDDIYSWLFVVKQLNDGLLKEDGVKRFSSSHLESGTTQLVVRKTLSNLL